MTKEELIALAERCEQADGPTFAFDAEIARAVGSSLWPPRNYTASIDAALTLVPEGYKIQLDTLDEAGAWVRVHAQSASNSWDGAASTPALALCAAALRARGE